VAPSPAGPVPAEPAELIHAEPTVSGRAESVWVKIQVTAAVLLLVLMPVWPPALDAALALPAEPMAARISSEADLATVSARDTASLTALAAEPRARKQSLERETPALSSPPGEVAARAAAAAAE
jgi:hypothetical protein